MESFVVDDGVLGRVEGSVLHVDSVKVAQNNCLITPPPELASSPANSDVFPFALVV